MNKKIGKISFKLSKKEKLFVLVEFLLVLGIFYYQLFIAPDFEDRIINAAISSAVATVFLILLLIGVFVYLDGIKKSLDSAHKEQQLNQLQAYTANLESLYTDMRLFRHEYMNIIVPLYAYINTKDYEGLHDYFMNSVVPIVKKIEAKNHSLDVLKNIFILELKGLLAVKLMQAQELGIQVHIEVADEIRRIDFDILDLTRIIGILLDNAIEASVESENPVLKFAAWQEEAVTTILIVNSFREPLPTLEQMTKKGFSTKGENRGLGLYTVDKITGSVDNVIINTFIKNGEFMQELKFLNKHTA